MDEKLKRAQSLVGTSEGRPELDFYPTPPEVTRTLLEIEPMQGITWEPACGDGAMSRVIKEYLGTVISTDVKDYGYEDFDGLLDFLSDDVLTLDRVDNVITNPPFNIGLDFVERALAMSRQKVAIFQKLAFLEGRKRAEMFRRTPLKTVMVFERRVSLYRNGEKGKNSGMIPFAWFVWDHSYTGIPVLQWVDHNDHLLPKNNR